MCDARRFLSNKSLSDVEAGHYCHYHRKRAAIHSQVLPQTPCFPLTGQHYQTSHHHHPTHSLITPRPPSPSETRAIPSSRGPPLHLVDTTLLGRRTAETPLAGFSSAPTPLITPLGTRNTGAHVVDTSFRAIKPGSSTKEKWLRFGRLAAGRAGPGEDDDAAACERHAVASGPQLARV